MSFELKTLARIGAYRLRNGLYFTCMFNLISHNRVRSRAFFEVNNFYESFCFTSLAHIVLIASL